MEIVECEDAHLPYPNHHGRREQFHAPTDHRSRREQFHGGNPNPEKRRRGGMNSNVHRQASPVGIDGGEAVPQAKKSGGAAGEGDWRDGGRSRAVDAAERRRSAGAQRRTAAGSGGGRIAAGRRAMESSGAARDGVQRRFVAVVAEEGRERSGAV